MKRLLLIPALLLATASMAQKLDYEFTPVAGYNINDNHIGLTNQTVFGGELQFNNLGYSLSPEISVLYSQGKYTMGKDVLTRKKTDIFRTAFNAVYEYEDLGFIIPLTKIGAGYESMQYELNENIDSMFVDVGIGAKIPLSENFALKAEAVYMAKYNADRWDNNLALLAGLNIAFGTSTKDAQAARVTELREQELQEARAKAEAAEIARKKAEEKAQMEENARKEAEAAAAASALALANANADDDKDGVKNTNDKCPNTPKEVRSVDSEGCIKQMNLHITFELSSYNVKEQSKANISKFGNFLKYSKKYKAIIVGHTDSLGSAGSNQLLSEKRAKVVRDMLVADGIPAEKVSYKGMGEKDPIASNMYKEGRAKNRRIEVELISIK